MEKSFSNSVSCGAQLINVTKLKRNIFTYEWTVENFGDFLERKYEIPSSVFAIDHEEKLKWKLVLFPQHVYPTGTHVAARLIKMSDDRQPLGVKYKIVIVSNFKDSKYQASNEKVFESYLDSDACLIVSHCEVMSQNLLANRNITLRCEIDALIAENPLPKSEYKPKVKEINSPSTIQHPSVCQTPSIEYEMKAQQTYKLENSYNILAEDKCFEEKTVRFDEKDSLDIFSDDFKTLYIGKKFSDVVITCENTRMQAHKAILYARSDFFKVICTERSACDNINISDIKSAAMEAILYYLYTGKMRQLTVDFSLNLILAAKKFRLQQLQRQLLDFLQANIKVDNVTDILQVCENLNLDELKRTCFKFVKSNHTEVIRSEKWQSLLKNNHHIAAEVLLTNASFQKTNNF